MMSVRSPMGISLLAMCQEFIIHRLHRLSTSV
jgi:hypothetical protein